MKKIALFAFLMLGLTLVFPSCQKEEEDNMSAEALTQDSEDVALAFDFFEDTDDEIELTVEELGLGVTIRSACPTVTVTPDRISFPRTITLDYGDAGCPGRAGRTRKGKIVITQSDSMNIPGATRVVTFENFFIDNARIEGVRTITFKGRNDKGQPYFTWSMENGKITYPDGTSVTWSNNYTRTQITGANTRIRIDDIFTITGSGQGISRKGHAYKKTITEPLVRAANCRWFQRGAVQMTVADRTWTMDYDNGAGLCDPIAIVTLPNGEQKRINILPWWRR